MFRIRRIYDATTQSNRERLTQVQSILRAQLPGVAEEDVLKMQEQLEDPLKYRFRSVLFVADGGGGRVLGFALLLHAPDLNFCYLDFISTGAGETGRGIGGALYERIREEVAALGVVGVFLECLPDDPELSPNEEIRTQNIARLKFYERYGARPIANTAYATPLKPGDTDPPFLVFDGLGHEEMPRRARVRKIVREILARKYPQCSPDYVDLVVNSFKDDPIQLRAPRYTKPSAISAALVKPKQSAIALIVSDEHQIHHVRERGYVESPVRIRSILEELDRMRVFERVPPKHFPVKHIEAVHKPEYVRYLQRATKNVPGGKSFYPYVFPIRNHARPPTELALRAGYYCIDTFTPLNENAYRAAIRAVDCALTGADRLLDGARCAYALVRPPGHHAERASFGGFCYLNSAAIAAHYLSAYGRVAVLDVDYHHGNGTQDIFYDRSDVLTISIHGHPRYSYPYFSGYEDERGEGEGEGFNVNVPLPEGIQADVYQRHLASALQKIKRFAPAFLVLSFGLDIARGDPTGSWLLGAKDFHKNGQMIAALGVQTLVVQEGGYRTRTLGVNARNFFEGLWNGRPEIADAK
jgi:acetoin utilization deacetylase AcuC-like enzyme/GNAT superfamily N-acetyltransferase